MLAKLVNQYCQGNKYENKDFSNQVMAERIQTKNLTTDSNQEPANWIIPRTSY